VKFYAIWKKEMTSYFASPIAYIIIGIFAIISGYFFYTDVLYFNLYNLDQTNLTEGLWLFYFNDLRYVLLIIIPLITMRLFSEEKKLNTLEMLLSYPIKTSELFFGKIFASMTFFIFLILLTLFYPLILSLIWDVEVLPLIASYLGFILLGLLFVSCGTFISSLTENQIVAAMGTYALLIFFWFLSWNEAVANENIMNILLQISAFDHFVNFTRGIVELKDVSYFLLVSLFFWGLCLLNLEKRRW
jgi:ABC-2 type transport system permease protein